MYGSFLKQFAKPLQNTQEKREHFASEYRQFITRSAGAYTPKANTVGIQTNNDETLSHLKLFIGQSSKYYNEIDENTGRIYYATPDTYRSSKKSTKLVDELLGTDSKVKLHLIIENTDYLAMAKIVGIDSNGKNAGKRWILDTVPLAEWSSADAPRIMTKVKPQENVRACTLTHSTEKQQNNLEAKIVRYNGNRYDSITEAKFAVFLDMLSLISGVHQPFDAHGTTVNLQGVDGNENTVVSYTPDFYLDTMKAWVEIKPCYPNEYAMQLAEALSKKFAKRVLVVYGGMRPPYAKADVGTDYSQHHEQHNGLCIMHWDETGNIVGHRDYFTLDNDGNLTVSTRKSASDTNWNYPAIVQAMKISKEHELRQEKDNPKIDTFFNKRDFEDMPSIKRMRSQ